jgi:hypothetical protein
MRRSCLPVIIIVVPYQQVKPGIWDFGVGWRPRKSIIAVVGGLAVGLLRVVVLGALDSRTRFVEQRLATGEVAIGKRVSGVLAGFDRLLMVVRTVLRVGGIGVSSVMIWV